MDLGPRPSENVIKKPFSPIKYDGQAHEASEAEYREGFALTEREFHLVKEALEPGTRAFLVKQGHHSIVCQLDLKGFEGELAVLSGRAEGIERLHRMMDASGTGPAGWLARFIAESAGG